MFSKDDEDQDLQAGKAEDMHVPTQGKSAPSIISADLKVVGNLHCSGDMQIDGTVQGDIESRTVTVGEGARIEGSISSESVTIRGAVSGETKADTVIVAKSAKVTGDIVHKTLSVESGAYLDGHCRPFEAEKGEQKVSPLKPAQAAVAGKGKPEAPPIADPKPVTDPKPAADPKPIAG